MDHSARTDPSHRLARVLVAVAAIAFTTPVVVMVLGSLRGRGLPPPRGLELLPADASVSAYSAVWAALPWVTYLRNSLVVVALAVPLTLLVGSLAGWGIRLLPGHLRRRVVVVTFVALLVPVTAVWATPAVPAGRRGAAAGRVHRQLPGGRRRAAGADPAAVRRARGGRWLRAHGHGHGGCQRRPGPDDLSGRQPGRAACAPVDVVRRRDPGPSGAAADPTGPGTQVGIPDPDDIDPGRLDPLAGLGPCPSPPAAVVGADTGGLPLPAGAVVTMASADGALRSVQGYSPRTPVEVMVAYLELDGWTVLSAEDEVFESEVLVERGDLRVFVKSQATCERGAAFVLFASEDAALVPAPAGTN